MQSSVQKLAKQPSARTLIPIGDHKFRGDNPQNFAKLGGPPQCTPPRLTSLRSPGPNSSSLIHLDVQNSSRNYFRCRVVPTPALAPPQGFVAAELAQEDQLQGPLEAPPDYLHINIYWARPLLFFIRGTLFIKGI